MALARSPFFIGDVVTSKTHPNWVGKVVDTTRFDSGTSPFAGARLRGYYWSR
jgi:hypothetical protein